MESTAFRDRIIRKAVELGADDAGVCQISDLVRGPTHSRFPLPPGLDGSHSILVLALSHPPEEPELDYFIRVEGFRFGNSEGNQRLRDISARMGVWLGDEGIGSTDLHYYVEMGGVFLKGAAVLAGLGIVGVNNLFIHPHFGPRVRLRAHLLETDLPPCPVLAFEPCAPCDRPCLTACPAGALDGGKYSSARCQEYMDREAAEAPMLPGQTNGRTRHVVRSCRICEFACSFKGKKES